MAFTIKRRPKPEEVQTEAPKIARQERKIVRDTGKEPHGKIQEWVSVTTKLANSGYQPATIALLLKQLHTAVNFSSLTVPNSMELLTIDTGSKAIKIVAYVTPTPKR